MLIEEDVARAKTGSGKTAAYLLPVLQAILKRKEVCSFTLFYLIGGGRRGLIDLLIARLLKKNLQVH